MQLCHLPRLLKNPSPKSATPQTISGEAARHIPVRPWSDEVAAVWIVSVVVDAAVPLGITVAGEKLQVEFAGRPVHVKLTARLKPPLGIIDT